MKDKKPEGLIREYTVGPYDIALSLVSKRGEPYRMKIIDVRSKQEHNLECGYGRNPQQVILEFLQAETPRSKGRSKEHTFRRT